MLCIVIYLFFNFKNTDTIWSTIGNLDLYIRNMNIVAFL